MTDDRPVAFLQLNELGSKGDGSVSTLACPQNAGAHSLRQSLAHLARHLKRSLAILEAGVAIH
jgi:hypothetical protein